MNLSLEISRTIFDDDAGRSLRVGPDADGLGLVEISGGDDFGRLVIPREMAKMLGDVLILAASDAAAD